MRRTVEDDLEDAVECNQASDVVRVAFGEFVPDQHHGDAAGDADEDEAAHVGRCATQEEHREQKHEHRSDDPVLHQRQAEDAAVVEDLAAVFHNAPWPAADTS